jgi:biopolymer transport protein ExbD
MSAGRITKRFDEINITPLTDIFLVLLIIMMVVAPMLNTQGLNISLPAITDAPLQSKPSKPIEMSITATNEIIVNGKTLASGESLASDLKALNAQFPDGVVLELHPKARHETTMWVMDAVQGAGIQNLSIVEGR